MKHCSVPKQSARQSAKTAAALCSQAPPETDIGHLRRHLRAYAARRSQSRRTPAVERMDTPEPQPLSSIPPVMPERTQRALSPSASRRH